MPTTEKPPRFAPGQRITAVRSGSSVGVAVVLETSSAGTTEIYRVRWADGHETFFVPGPDVRCEPRDPAVHS
jgi:uncharacterized protein DUF1918